jgi:hypothetical protein
MNEQTDILYIYYIFSSLIPITGMTEVVASLCIELTSCLYLRSVFIKNRTKLDIRDLGVFEWSALASGLYSIFIWTLTIVYWVITLNTLSNSSIQIIMALTSSPYYTFHPFMVCSLMSSVNQFKEDALELNRIANSTIQTTKKSFNLLKSKADSVTQFKSTSSSGTELPKKGA